MTAPKSSSESLIETLVNMGFDRNAIVDHGSYFVVEGDMRIEKEDLVSRGGIASSTRVPGLPNFQWSTNYLVSRPKVADLRIAIDGGVNAAWADAVRDAMDAWNNLPGAIVHFSEATPADITISYGSLPDGVYGQAPFSTTSGSPGSVLYLNNKYTDSLSASQKIYVVVHELGHTIGLRHTNWQGNEISGSVGANLIAGTPSTDYSSVMNGGTAGYSFTGFSYYDRVAVRALYPMFPQFTYNSTADGNYVTTNMSWTAVKGADHYQIVQHEEMYDWEIGTIVNETTYSVYGLSFSNEANCNSQYSQQYNLYPVFSDGAVGPLSGTIDGCHF